MNPGELYCVTLKPGDCVFSSRGIIEIQGFYQEDDLNKVRFWLHTVDRDDGVTATGAASLMSTTPGILQSWIDSFPRDIAERKRSVVSKNMHSILNRIDQAEAEGPKVKGKSHGAS